MVSRCSDEPNVGRTSPRSGNMVAGAGKGKQNERNAL
jgi:hypothetical protein